MERLARGEPDLVCDFWTEISRNLAANLEAGGWPDLTPAQYANLYEVEDYRVMERLRRRIGSIVKDKKRAEMLKPYFRFRCKRPCSNDEYLQTFNRANVTLIDVSATRGVERITEKGLVGDGTEYEVDCIIYASGFESGADLRVRTGIQVVEGRNGRSLYEHWSNGYKTLHGFMTHGFPNQFFTGFTQCGVSWNLTEMYDQQCCHFAYIIKEALSRGDMTVEPSQEAQDAWCKIMKENEVDNTEFFRECTPSYFNSEGKENARGLLGGELYGPGFHAFDRLLSEWRDKGDMAGLTVGTY
jgi:cyclohexanone monooxygenase